MALPTLTKTWNISANNVITTQSSWLINQRKFWYGIVTFLKSAGWTTQAASNGTTASISVDWTSSDNLNWGQVPSSGATVPFSWIVLRNNTIGIEICLQLASSSNPGGGQNYYSIVGSFTFGVSPGGYNVSGTLSTSSRPPTNNGDETLLRNFESLFSNNDNSTIVWHGWRSSDNECTRIAAYKNDSLYGLIILDKVSQPTTGWAKPFVSTFMLNNAGAGVSLITGDSSNIMASRFDTTNLSMYLSSERIGTGVVTAASPTTYCYNDLTREFSLTSLGLVSTTAPFRGHHGNMFDMWFTMPATNGTLLPNTTLKTLSMHGGLVLPWDGTSLVKTR